jgi:hypothetical protein
MFQMTDWLLIKTEFNLNRHALASLFIKIAPNWRQNHKARPAMDNSGHNSNLLKYWNRNALRFKL